MLTAGKATAVKAMMVAAATMGIALAGCGSAGTAGSSASSGPSAADSASAGSGSSSDSGSAASCVVGNWKTTSVDGKFDSNGVNGTLAGGSGVTMNVAPDGKTTVNFDSMDPVTFNFAVAGGNVKGSFKYAGTVNGAVKTPSTPTGVWEPVGNVDFGKLTVTVDLTSPTAARVADKLPLAQFVGTNAANAGNAVDGQPILRRSTYDCSSGSTLKLGPPAGTAGVGTWTLEKA